MSLCYVDDTCLITLSSSGMQQLLNICQNYATNHQLLYNGAKSFSLCFKNNAIKVSLYPCMECTLVQVLLIYFESYKLIR